jgi:phosphoglucomutase
LVEEKDIYTQRANEYLECEDHSDFITELKGILESGDSVELEDRFYRDLEFGTGGLRGIIGAGFNRINPNTIKRATAGLIRYMMKTLPEAEHDSLSVAIAYDSRRYSREFAETTALVCAAHGVKGYVFESLRPTPELSFAVRSLGASAGIVVTASHNPSDYNGYKVYWSDGSQIVPPHDSGIIGEVRNVSGRVDIMDKHEAIKLSLYEEIGEDIDNAFLDMLESYLIQTQNLDKKGSAFSVVYTPLHGAGTMLMESIFDRMGVDYTTVPEQREPDGEFPTVASPNPEEGAALHMAIELAKKTGADLVLGTDPDADRLGVAVRSNDDEYRLLSGNQLGSLLADYLFASKKAHGTLPANPALIKTIVTTELQRHIAESYGGKVYDVLTGFKYIGEKLREFETSGENYVFGGEESYGYLVETEVRDKDSIGAAAVTVEMARYCATKGWSLLDYLEDIYMRFGYFEELLVTKKFPGSMGADRIQTLMNQLRGDIPKYFAGERVLSLIDYSDGRIVENGVVSDTRIELPRSNVLQLKLDSAVFTVRPSGTEPKIKYYASCWADVSCEPSLARKTVSERIAAIKSEIDAMG